MEENIVFQVFIFNLKYSSITLIIMGFIIIIFLNFILFLNFT